MSEWLGMRPLNHTRFANGHGPEDDIDMGFLRRCHFVLFTVVSGLLLVVIGTQNQPFLCLALSSISDASATVLLT